MPTIIAMLFQMGKDMVMLLMLLMFLADFIEPWL